MAVDADSTELSDPPSDQPDVESIDATDDPDTVTTDSANPILNVRFAIRVGLATVVALAGLAGWLGYRLHQSHQAEVQRNLFVEIARQGALNLTTINYTQVGADVQRILDSATGTFYDDFQKRSQPFIEVVKQAQSKSDGSIVDAGLQSETGDQAQVLVAVNVNTSVAGAAEPEPRAWRMRISVQKIGDGAKVSNVEFVS
jgi:Mce-associated membrane protein